MTLLLELAMWLLILLAACAVIIWQWQMLRRLRHALASHRLTDELTGLLQRRHFLQLAEHELNRAQRASQATSALLIDLDHCAKINHRFGHQAGDLALQHVADAIRASIRDFDLAARFSGEEIVVLLPNTPAPGAQIVAERIRQKVKASSFNLPDGIALTVSVTMGLATQQSETAGIEDLLLAADSALQQAMQQGIDRIAIYQEQAAVVV
ncbi:GGDEF domain-containing protein [Chitinibacter tainanensis]|uniref:GGDEF domain-containing protein n=1 Tax=Chitinibacter tainanensis TaxID=230667 RepID=UPI0004056344|nr:GGDEF domain-containing protein [Chitinibacter tainanensis]